MLRSSAVLGLRPGPGTKGFELDEDFVGFLPCLRRASSHSAGSVGSRPAIFPDLLAQCWPHLLNVGQKLVQIGLLQTCLSQFGQSFFPLGLELEGIHLFALLKNVPLTAHPELLLHGSFAKLQQPFLDLGIHLFRIGDSTLHLVPVRLPDVLVDHFAAAGQARLQGHQSLPRCHALPVVCESVDLL